MKQSFLTNFDQGDNPQDLQSHLNKFTTYTNKYFDVEEYYNKYILHQNLFTKDQLENQDDFTILKGKNYLYFGGLKDYVKKGWGVLLVGQVIYEGRFQNNQKCGIGYQKQRNNAIYNGQFRNSLFQGYGTLTYRDGSKYSGNFYKGLMSGEGMWINDKGDKYIGQWLNGEANGRGILISHKNDKYEGEFLNFSKHGEGIQTFANGDIFKGRYDGNTPNGYGQYSWSNGSIFKGMFMNGLKHGRGIWISLNGDSYEGQYENDRKSGQGQMRWENGNIYIGEFFNDLRHGEGEMRWINGTKFIGTWQKGIPDGPGIMTSFEKGERRGIFKNNIMTKEIKDWKGPSGLKKKKPKQIDKTYDKSFLKVIPQKTKRIERSRQKSNKNRENIDFNLKSTQPKRGETPILYEPKFKKIPHGYRDSSLSVGSRGFPIYIKPNISLNSSPLNIRIRIQKTKKGFDILARQIHQHR